MDGPEPATIDPAPLRESRTVDAECPPAEPCDPLWHRAPAPYAVCRSVMGVPVEMATNAPEVMRLVDAAFGRWPLAGDVGDGPAARARFFLHERQALDEDADAPSPTMRRQGPRFFLWTRGSLAFADRAAGFAVAYVTPALLRNRRFAQIGIVECLVMSLVQARRPAALHAACVVSSGRCALLAGPCGAGKSTLAYACARAGMGLVSDDVVYGDGAGDCRAVWGLPWVLHLPADAVRFYPELRGEPPVRELSGEEKLLVDVAARWPQAPVPRGRVDAVLTLSRAVGPQSRVVPGDVDEAVEALAHFGRDAEPREGAQMRRAARRLAGLRLGRLEVGSDMGAAAEVVGRWMAS